MRWHKSPNRFFTGRHLFTCAAVTVVLALGAPAAAAKECRRETPLPADMRLIPAGPDVPETVARFAGAWRARGRLRPAQTRSATRSSSKRCSRTALPVSSTATGPTRD